MKVNIKYFFGVILAILIGTLPAFFVVFVSIFSDGGGIGERIFTFFYDAVVYGVLGFVFGVIGPRFSWKWGIWLSLTAFILVIWYTFRESERAVLHMVYLAITLVAASLGGYLGALVKGRK